MEDMIKTYKGRKIVRGKAEGEAIVCPDSFSFLGDVDLATGEIIAPSNPNKGKLLKDKILIFKESKGSSGGCVVLKTLVQKKVAPAALVTVKAPDYNLTEGIDNIEQTPYLYSENEYYGSPSWQTINFYFRYKATKNIDFLAAFDNVLDVHYKEFASAISAPGRNISITVLGSF